MTTNRIEFAVGGRVYPRQKPTPKEAPLPEPFGQLAAEILQGRSLSKKRPTDPKIQIIDAFGRSVNAVNSGHEDIRGLIRAIADVSIEVRTDRKHLGRRAAIRQAKLEELAKLLPDIKLEQPDVLDWNLAAKPSHVIHKTLSAHLEAMVDRMVRQLVECLDTLVDKRMIGFIQWHEDDPTVCLYQYFRSVVIQREIDVRSSTVEWTGDKQRVENHSTGVWQVTAPVHEKTTTQRDQERTHRIGRHEHHLVNAERLRWPGIERTPSWVARFISDIPAWLRPHIAVVAGDMVREKIVERDTRQEHWTETEEQERVKGSVVIEQGRLWSPAVCLGHYVLTGWSDRDLLIDDEISRGVPAIR